MAIGDAALAAGMELVAGSAMANTIDTAVNQTRDYIAERTAAVTPVDKGGTGANTAAGARANLGVQTAVDDTAAATASATEGKLVRYGTGGRINVGAPNTGSNAATKDYVDGRVASVAAGVPADGGTFTGQVYFPNATAATSGYVVAYLNEDGRLSRGASSERYKTDIVPIDPDELGDVWPQLVSYRMIDGDGTAHIGYIAERLDEHPDQQPFVVYGALPDEHIPESIDFIALLMAQNAQLHQHLDLLAQRLDALEAP